jgi:hypothetical protein
MGILEMLASMNSSTNFDRYLLVIMMSLHKSSGWMCLEFSLLSPKIPLTVYSAHFCNMGSFRMILFKYFCCRVLY